MNQYGVKRGEEEAVERQPRRSDAADIARDWANSPLRTGPRQAHLMRRKGWDGEWQVIATWASPEWPR